jgi:hypothetical protein
MSPSKLEVYSCFGQNFAGDAVETPETPIRAGNAVPFGFSVPALAAFPPGDAAGDEKFSSLPLSSGDVGWDPAYSTSQ